MKESFLHYLWKFKLFIPGRLKTTDGKEVEIINSGTHNTNAGPDFFNAKVKIGDTTWAGNVEIHIKSSDFFLHKHQHDKSYENLILHVVFENDVPAINNYFTLQVKDSFDRKLLQNYNSLQNSTKKLACSGTVASVPNVIFKSWLDGMFFERMESKAFAIEEKLSQNTNNLDEVFYFQLAANFGFKINQEPFELLARKLPFSILAKHRNNLFQLESLLLGVAGFLGNEFEESYPRELQNEFRFLQKKFSLSTMDVSNWKFLRMRPGNFPTLRIAQFAALINKSGNVFSSFLNATSAKEIEKVLDIVPSSYWNNHYRLDVPSDNKKKRLGKKSKENIIINSVIPFLFIGGKNQGKDELLNRANKLVNELKPEENNITKLFSSAGKKPENAAESQAMINLYKNFCSAKRCDNCAAGNYLLKNL
ncbi:MAG: DUF2851 family protein [Bacteroidota bacterium]|jgi:hypothetical protein